ncbi:MAG: hypothetical protein ABSB15_24205 [Bryobacteraceae bacterium]|jgi:hypothetical protein
MKFAALFVCIAAAFGQIPPTQDAVIALANTPTAQTVKQMTIILKTIADVPEVSFDEAHSSFTLRGWASQLGLAEWLLRAMDKPAGWQPPTQESADHSSREYHLPKASFPFMDRNPVARVYYLTNTTTPLGVEEILQGLRVVGDIQQVYKCDEARLIAFRGTAANVDVGEWIIRKLDVPTGGEAFARQKENPDAGILKLPNDPAGHEDIVRVFYLEPALTQKEIYRVLAKIRTATNTRSIFQMSSPPAIVFRGTSAQLAQARQMIDAQ